MRQYRLLHGGRQELTVGQMVQIAMEERPGPPPVQPGGGWLHEVGFRGGGGMTTVVFGDPLVRHVVRRVNKDGACVLVVRTNGVVGAPYGCVYHTPNGIIEELVVENMVAVLGGGAAAAPNPLYAFYCFRKGWNIGYQQQMEILRGLLHLDEDHIFYMASMRGHSFGINSHGWVGGIWALHGG